MTFIPGQTYRIQHPTFDFTLEYVGSKFEGHVFKFQTSWLGLSDETINSSTITVV